jgi:hypothetical protein
VMTMDRDSLVGILILIGVVVLIVLAVTNA